MKLIQQSLNNWEMIQVLAIIDIIYARLDTPNNNQV